MVYFVFTVNFSPTPMMTVQHTTTTAEKTVKKVLDHSAGLQKHAGSEERKNCHVKWSSFSCVNSWKSTSEMYQLSEAHLRLVEENKRYITPVAKILLFTPIQGIGQRGHIEIETSSNWGNVLELRHFLAELNTTELNDKLKSLPSKLKTQNEIITVMSDIMVLKNISQNFPLRWMKAEVWVKLNSWQ